MKLMHISDLHIGKTFKNLSLLEDQRFILDQIVQIAQNEHVDGVLIAGDVYQKSSPQAEAMTLFDDFINRLCAGGIRVFMISGNHDSEQRIAYFSRLIRRAGVYANECFDGTIQKVELTDIYGKINIHLLPFIKPANVRAFYPDEKIASYQDAVALALKNSPIDLRERNILLCHQFITGAETSESEEKTIGGLDNIDASLFDEYDYVALGHIHKPQRLRRDTLRYAGSPLKYSLSEAEHRKSVCIVDIREKDDVTVKTCPLTPLHEVRRVAGLFDDVMAMPYSEDYVAVTLHDETIPRDAQVDIRNTVFPNMISFGVENSKMKETRDVIATETIENKTPMDLFADFFRLQNNDVDPTEKHMDIFEKALKAAMEGDKA